MDMGTIKFGATCIGGIAFVFLIDAIINFGGA